MKSVGGEEKRKEWEEGEHFTGLLSYAVIIPRYPDTVFTWPMLMQKLRFD